MTSTKVIVTYELNEGINYVARVLGLLNEKQFASLYLKSEEFAKKLSTAGSVSLDDIYKAPYRDKRLAFVIKEDIGADVKLLVSKPLTHVYTSHCNMQNKLITIGFMDKDNHRLLVKLT